MDLMDFVNLRASSLDVRADTETLNIFITIRVARLLQITNFMARLPDRQGPDRLCTNRQRSPVALCAAANYNFASDGPAKARCWGEMKNRKPPILQYVCLGTLFVVACAYQVRATIAAFPAFFQADAAQWPFYPAYSHGQPIAEFVRENAQGAGLHENDVLTAINGRAR